ncbi:MAG: anaerobic ribonucleoside-triphosphate reductase activating protein [Xylanivirga thermophila]|jgi:anaerobic ribonucleoside-triphosphate reductase activating protein|uniref:anaerobic ribonucleoside-triphosphate reductase activating protein n=1 Tax=Xylanivirga thermophila TaxID=2496273 RepID=UPI00101D9C5D|nr:anaerobic ribonucleoside-triphosphate reductase activating protein [Xylanivirga thermophila]
MDLQIAGFLDNSLVNGEGLRFVVFVSGCRHNCDGCHNREMQDFQYGKRMDVGDILKKIEDNMPLIKGVTFSGGEPFEQAEALHELALKIKEKGLDIWCYTGYKIEDIINSGDDKKIALLKEVDILVDGKFDKNLVDNPLKYTGSSNQRIIDVKKFLSSTL